MGADRAEPGQGAPRLVVPEHDLSLVALGGDHERRARLAEGRSSPAIARELGVSRGTLYNYIRAYITPPEPPAMEAQPPNRTGPERPGGAMGAQGMENGEY